jgi:predicted nucleic acid-binding protein
MELILDTEFVIALERERIRNQEGPAKCFLSQHASDHFVITFTVAGELACGRSADAKKAWQRLCRPFLIIPWNPEISWIYGEVFRKLQADGNLIGANDLWISATVLSRKATLVSNNRRDFGRIPELDILSY